MKKVYSAPVKNTQRFTRIADIFYAVIAGMYDIMIRLLPGWKNKLLPALPHIKGPKVLEVSFGTGYLISQYAEKYETHGLDYNSRMLKVAARNLKRAGKTARLIQGTVEDMPYEDASFDTLVNTMAFSGYPDPDKAFKEILRVLKKEGRIVMIDVDYPKDENIRGMRRTRAWIALGDFIIDKMAFFAKYPVNVQESEIANYGSVHMYIISKK